MKKELKRTWYLLFAALAIGGYFILANVLQLLAYKIIPDLIQFQQENQKEIMYYLNGVDLVVSLILLIVVFAVYRRLKKGADEGKKIIDGIAAVKCVIAGIALAGISFVISTIFSLDITSGGEMTNTGKVIMLFITSVGFAPLIEEFLFRGILYHLLSKFKEGWIAIILSALIFAVYHGDPIQAVFTFIMGVVFAFTYYKTKNIKYPILIHIANNAFVVLAGFVLPTGMRAAANWFSVIMILPLVIFSIKVLNMDR